MMSRMFMEQSSLMILDRMSLVSLRYIVLVHIPYCLHRKIPPLYVDVELFKGALIILSLYTVCTKYEAKGANEKDNDANFL